MKNRLPRPFLIFFLATIYLFASAETRYSIEDIAAGIIPGMSVSVIGNEHANLGLTVRIVGETNSACIIDIPAGTVFSESGLKKQSAACKAMASQSMMAPFASSISFPGGSIPKKKQGAATAETYFSEKDIIALCMNVDLPPPDRETSYQPVISNLEQTPLLSSFVKAVNELHESIPEITGKISQQVQLDDDEFEKVAFFYWNSPDSAVSSATLNQVDLQNVLWCIIPPDATYSPASMRNSIVEALHIDDSTTMRYLNHEADRLLCYLGSSRRLSDAPGESYLIEHRLAGPTLESAAWNGSGAGWAARISPRGCDASVKGPWQVNHVRFMLQAAGSGSFDVAICKSANGRPGPVTGQPITVTYSGGLESGDTWLMTDVSEYAITVDGDFFVVLYQTQANAPRVIKAGVNESRSFAFNGGEWTDDSASLTVGVVVTPVDPAWSAPKVPLPAAKQPTVTAAFHNGLLSITAADGVTVFTATICDLSGQKIADPGRVQPYGTLFSVPSTLCNGGIARGTYCLLLTTSIGVHSVLIHFDRY